MVLQKVHGCPCANLPMLGVVPVGIYKHKVVPTKTHMGTAARVSKLPRQTNFHGSIWAPMKKDSEISNCRSSEFTFIGFCQAGRVAESSSAGTGNFSPNVLLSIDALKCPSFHRIVSVAQLVSASDC